MLDQGLDLAAIWADVVKRPYITVGHAGIRHSGAARRHLQRPHDPPSGGGAWQRLHRLVYAAAAAAAMHFVMVVKSWPAEPLIYAALVMVLLLFRLLLGYGSQPSQSGADRARPQEPEPQGTSGPPIWG